MSKKNVVLLLTLGVFLFCGFGFATMLQGEPASNSAPLLNRKQESIAQKDNPPEKNAWSTFLLKLDPKKYGGAYYLDGEIHLIPIKAESLTEYLSTLPALPWGVVIDQEPVRYSLYELMVALDGFSEKEMREVEVIGKYVDMRMNRVEVYGNGWPTEVERYIQQQLGIDNIFYNKMRSSAFDQVKEKNPTEEQISQTKRELPPMWAYKAHGALEKKMNPADYGSMYVTPEEGKITGLTILAVHKNKVKQAIAACGYEDYPIKLISAKYSVEEIERIEQELMGIVGDQGSPSLDIFKNHFSVRAMGMFPELLTYIDQNDYWDFISVRIGHSYPGND